MILGAESATITRYGAQTRDADTGRATPGSTSTISFTGSFQPVKGREREALEEGIRTSVRLKVYTETEMRTADQDAKTPADRVTYKGENYTVVQVEEWPQLLDHYKAFLIKEQEA